MPELRNYTESRSLQMTPEYGAQAFPCMTSVLAAGICRCGLWDAHAMPRAVSMLFMFPCPPCTGARPGMKALTACIINTELVTLPVADDIVPCSCSPGMILVMCSMLQGTHHDDCR